MRKNSKENEKGKNKDNVYKIKSDKLNNKLIEKDKKEVKTIEISVGFTVLKIIVIALIISLITALTAKTVMTKIRAKESTSETGNEGIASIAEIDVQSTFSDDESYSTVTITSNYPITQIEVSEEDYNEDLEEEDYIFIVEDDWEVTEDGLVLTKDFTENIDKAYRLTFEDETSIIYEIIIEDFHSNETESDKELEGEATVTSKIDENGVTTISTEEDDDYMVVVTEITQEYISVEYDFTSTSSTSRCLLGCG